MSDNQNTPNDNPKSQEYFEVKALFRDFKNNISELHDLLVQAAVSLPGLVPSLRDSIKTMEQMQWDISSAFDVWNFCRGNDELAKVAGILPGEKTGVLGSTVRDALRTQINGSTTVIREVQVLLAK